MQRIIQPSYICIISAAILMFASVVKAQPFGISTNAPSSKLHLLQDSILNAFRIYNLPGNQQRLLNVFDPLCINPLYAVSVKSDIYIDRFTNSFYFYNAALRTNLPESASFDFMRYQTIYAKRMKIDRRREEAVAAFISLLLLPLLGY